MRLVAQVAWQALREDIDMGDTPQAGNHPASVGAVLTSQRLLLLSPQLRVLVAAPPGPAITSFLWLGPALLYATSDHQVRGPAGQTPVHNWLCRPGSTGFDHLLS